MRRHDLQDARDQGRKGHVQIDIVAGGEVMPAQVSRELLGKMARRDMRLRCLAVIGKTRIDAASQLSRDFGCRQVAVGAEHRRQTGALGRGADVFDERQIMPGLAGRLGLEIGKPRPRRGDPRLRGELDHAGVAEPIGHRAVDAGTVDDEFVGQDEMMHRDRRAIGHRCCDPGRCDMQGLEDPAGDRRPLVIAHVKTVDAVARPVHRSRDSAARCPRPLPKRRAPTI